MKKIILSALLASAVLSASDYKYEVSPMVGYAYPSDGQQLRDHAVYGAEMQFDDLGTALKPELSLLYSDADYKDNQGETDIFRVALNGVYDFSKTSIFTPFVKAGIGYETLSDAKFNNPDSVFADAGAGVKVGLTQQLSLKLEAIKMLKFNDFNWDNNLLVMAGLNFAFGEKAQAVAPVPVAPAAVVSAKPAPKPAPTPVIAAPAEKVCPVNVDSDKDGVFDPQDKCPNTPAGFKVDADGCPLKATLRLNFITDGYTVDAAGIARVKDFAAFLQESPAYKANIVGHTDNTASDKYNQKLSEKRAEKIKTMLIDQGIAADRLTASGKGEIMPIASNKTKQGRAENRRIEVELTH